MLRNGGIHKSLTQKRTLFVAMRKTLFENIMNKRIRVNFHLVAHMKTSEKKQERDDGIEDDTHDG